MPNVKCVICGQPFYSPRRGKYCSPDCIAKGARLSEARRPLRHVQEKERVDKHCPTCGKLIWGKSTYCHKHKRPDMPKGAANPSWKGGRFQSKGYCFVRNPTHPRANANGYVREHILVWEQTHSQSLPDGYVVHHLNGIRNDNRPSNLVALLNQKHRFVLAAKAKRIQELEALLKGQGVLI